MISVTQRKPGPIRRFTSRLVFLVVGELASRSIDWVLERDRYDPFARWVTPPNSPDVVFLSNYDASWESLSRGFHHPRCTQD
jgi:hypothetical protein